MIVHHIVFMFANIVIFLYACTLLGRMRRVEDKGLLETLVVGVLLVTPLSILANLYDVLQHRASTGADFYTNLKVGEEWFNAFINFLVLKTVKRVQTLMARKAK